MAIRKPDIIESEIRLLDNSLFKAESLLLQFPEDNLLRLTIEQDKHRRVVLIDELKASIAENQQNSVYFFLYARGIYAPYPYDGGRVQQGGTCQTV